MTAIVESMGFSDKLKQLRGAKTLDCVANAVGISRSALNMYELGKRIPRDEVKIALANYYGKPVSYIFFNGDVT